MKTMASYRIPLIAAALLLAMVACSVLPENLLPQFSTAATATPTQPPSQTTVFPTQPVPGAAISETPPAGAPPPPAAEPTAAPPPSAPQSPSQGGQPAASAERINFLPGSTAATTAGSLPPNGIKQYVLPAMQAVETQNIASLLDVQLFVSSGQPVLSIWGADGTVLISDHAGATQWSGALPSTQDYYISVSNQSGEAAHYTIQVIIPSGNSPVPTAPPSPAAGRIHFAPGSSAATVLGNVAANASDHYVLKALAGQTMTVELSASANQAILVIWGADGTVLISDHAGATQWSGVLPASQDYFIDVRNVSQAAVRYTMKVTIPPLGK
jgi:hypothetical protein